MLTLRNIAIQRGGRTLLEKVDLVLHAGQKAGITGVNGCGKSSLFALLLGELHAETGEAELPGGVLIAHVAQEVPAGTQTALDFVLAGDAAVARLESELRAAEQEGDGTRLAHLYADYEAHDGYRARSRAATILHGLGFVSADHARCVEEFSGGWRARLNLARALMCPSDLLLLDEPTNHLDLDAVIWLEGWLQRYPGTLSGWPSSRPSRIVSSAKSHTYAHSSNASAPRRPRRARRRVDSGLWHVWNWSPRPRSTRRSASRSASPSAARHRCCDWRRSQQGTPSSRCSKTST
jgi:ABC-type cobalamin/Fe3+-siderophores transport system ATPase subunit